MTAEKTLAPIPPPQFDKIPEAIRAIPHWVCFKAPIITKPDGTQKYSKVPIDPKTGRNASANRPETWGTFDQARAWYEDHTDTVAGVGFEFQRGCGVIGIDFDHVLAENGECNDDAWAAITAFDSYTERSPSGDGLHTFVFGNLPDAVTSAKYPAVFSFATELFQSKFFLTVTGDRCDDLPATVEKRQKVLTEYYTQLEAANRKAAMDEETPAEFGDVATFEAGVLPLLAPAAPGPRQPYAGDAGHPGFKWTIQCPWADTHSGGDTEACVFFFTSGNRPGFRCLHAHCADKRWKDLAAIYSLPLPSWIDDYNAEYAVADVGGKCIILHEKFDPVMDRPTLGYSRPGDFHALHANRTRTYKKGGKTTEIQLSQEWFKSPHRRQYDGVIFDPSGKQHNGSFNLWRGFSVVPAPGDWSLMRAHIRDVICAGEEECDAYVMAWLADLFQAPAHRPGVCVAMRGAEGTGKGIFAKEVGACIKPHFIHLTAAGQLLGNFNHHLSGGLLIFADEALFAGDRSTEGALKALITEETQLVTPKGVDSFPMRNFARILMATNSSWSIPAGMGSRRFLMLDVAETHTRDIPYFAALARQQENGGRAAMLHDLLSLSYDRAALRLAPQTEALTEQKLHSMTSVERYLSDCLEHDGLMLADEDGNWLSRDTWPDEPLKDDIYHGYMRHAKDGHERHPKARHVFFKELLRAFGGTAGSHTRRAIRLCAIETVRERWEDLLAGRRGKLPF